MIDTPTEKTFFQKYRSEIKVTPVGFYDNLFLLQNDFAIKLTHGDCNDIPFNCKFSITTFEKFFEFSSINSRVVPEFFKIVGKLLKIQENNVSLSFHSLVLKHYFLDSNYPESLVFKLLISFAVNESKYEKEFWFHSIKENKDITNKIFEALDQL